MAQNEEFPTVRANQAEEVSPTIKRQQEGFAPTRPLAEGIPGYEPRAVGETETVVLGAPPPSFAWLVIKDGPRAGRLFRLNPTGTTIGRDSRNDIILDDEAVSRQHAKVRAEKGEGGEEQFFIYDLASENSTFVNGEQIVKQALEDGDEVVIGKTPLVFKKI